MPSFSFSYHTYEHLEELLPIAQELVQRAITAAQEAYAPYSKFNVGCAIRLESGVFVQGANVENASYPVGICAERVALSYMISNHSKQQIESIAISYQYAGKDKGVIYPCGMCRQFILECQQRNKKPIELILHAPSGKVNIIPDAANLLPFGFTEDMF